jgi:hypothetical protein
MKLFFLYIAINGWVVIISNAFNVYAQTSIPKDVEHYFAVDQQMKDWWKDKYGTDITVGMSSCILKALHGHPRAGQWWTDKIEKTSCGYGF